MKKLLGILGSICLLSITNLNVIACGDKKIDIESERELEKVITKFKKEVNQIIQNHIEEKTQSFFLTEGEKTSNFDFFNKKAIETFVGSSEIKKPSDEIKKYILKDFNNIFGTSILKTKIDSLKNNEEYSIILGSVQSIFKDLVLSSNDKIEIKSKISSSTEEKIWFGSIRVEYSITVNYMNKNQQLEEYKVSDITSVVSLTDSEEIAGNIQTMYSEIGETFIKDDISKIYLDRLVLQNKTYLNNINRELLAHLNSIDYRLSIENWIKNKFRVSVIINEIRDLKVISSYRSESIDLDDNNSGDAERYYELLDRVVNTDGFQSNTKKLLSMTQNEMENLMIKSIRSNLDNISERLSENNEVESIINGAFKVNKITLSNLTYKISQDEYIDIPNLYLNLAQFKDESTLTRDKMEEDIKDNLLKATYNFTKTYNIGYAVKDTHTGLDFYSLSSGTALQEWKLAVTNKKYISNMDELTNLELNSLIDRRNKFISDTKQSNFNFQVSWGPSNENSIVSSVKAAKKGINFDIENKLEYFPVYTTLEFDYFKLRMVKNRCNYLTGEFFNQIYWWELI